MVADSYCSLSSLRLRRRRDMVQLGFLAFDDGIGKRRIVQLHRIGLAIVQHPVQKVSYCCGFSRVLRMGINQKVGVRGKSG